MLAYAFAIRSVTSIALERTVDDAPNAQKRIPTINETPWLICIRDMDVLLVDDVLGTGLTLATAMSIVTAYKPRSLRSLVSVVNVANADAARTVDVTYVGMRTDRWVTFPWEIVHAES
jgi:hypoxanthine phosphoribosyltransferase